ncbi:PAS domain-containing protein [Spirosoma sp. BT702]|uniref:histidine kinase n=1 Tax=Spirosoma profusum TaxID=2771354 RepID=A0A926XX23_9BACT|nr:ATP-binding protein [Spirosoma profusum]MBD2702439.1 PAS domain-containing protein [Spirosoma profusum]
MNAFHQRYINDSELPENRQTDNLLGAIFESAPVCIVSYRALRNDAHEIIDFKPLLLNERAVTTCGRSRQEIMDATLLELFPPLQGSALLTDYLTTTQSGEPQRNDYYIPPFGGWFDVSVNRIGPDEIAAIFIDITARKEAELQMRQQADLLTQISQSMQMAVSGHLPVRDEQGRIIDFQYTYFNEKAKAWLPVDWRQVVGQTVRTMAFSKNSDQTIARMASVVETGEPVQFDVITPDGRVFFNIVARSGEGTVSTFIDVTAQRQAEENLRELKSVSERQTSLLQSILDASLTAIACYDAVCDEQGIVTDFQYTLANQTTLAIMNRTPDELYGKTICEVNPALQGSGVVEEYIRVYETGQPVVMERENKGRYYYVSLVKFGDGVLTSSIDITESQNYRSQLETANVALQQSNSNLQSFAYVASHDLQEPLRKIKAFGDLILNEYSAQLPEHGQDMLRRMQSAAERMSGLIRDLLALSRLTTQKRNFAPVNLENLVNEILSDLETTVAETGASVSVGVLPTVQGDALQLRQLFQNLLSNALKFRRSEQPSSIQVESSRVRARDIQPVLLTATPVNDANSVDATSAGNPIPDPLKQYYVLTVTDNGIGFDSSRHGETIFGAFQRLHGRSGTFSGTGIGLAIAKKVVENHNGAIVAHSHEGEGARFSVYLPIRS